MIIVVLIFIWIGWSICAKLDCIIEKLGKLDQIYNITGELERLNRKVK